MRFFISCLLLCIAASTQAQEIKLSLPQSMPYGINHAAVLGTCSAGILTREYGKNTNWIECYDNDLNQKWRKELLIPDKSPDIEEIFLSGDSLIVFYTTYSHSRYILKANLYSNNLFILKNAYVIDTLPTLFSSDNLELNYVQSFNKKKMMVFYENSDFGHNRKIFYNLVNINLDELHRSLVVLPPLKNPEVLDALLGDDNIAYFIYGDKEGNSSNYNYSGIGIQYVFPQGGSKNLPYNGNGKMFSVPQTKFDFVNKRIVMAGVFSDKRSDEGNGTYYLRSELNDTVTFAKQMIPFTSAFISYLSGNPQPKKDDGFFDYKTTDIIVKKDGGVLLVTESQSQNTETVGGNTYGGFGMNTLMTITYYHYNDITVFSVDSNGTGQWYQVLRKKQTSDNDGGYYLSYGLLIGPQALYFFYNDQLNSENSLSAYSLDASGISKRDELMNSDRKNLAPIPKEAKQIGLRKYAMPSLRKGYFQLITVTF
jgi:hypothetical protein